MQRDRLDRLSQSGINIMCTACGNHEHVNAGFQPLIADVVAMFVKPHFTVEQIVAQLQTQWSGDREGDYYKWSGSAVSYSLPNTTPFGENDEENGFQAMAQVQLDLAREAFEQWDDLIAIDLNESTAVNSQITMAYSSTTRDNGTYAASERDGSTIEDVEIWLSSNWQSLNQFNIAYSNYGFQTHLHEIGHALGLSHAGSYNASDDTDPTYANSAEFAQDNRQNTIMSYFGGYNTTTDTWEQDGTDSGWAYSATPMLYDIAAIQAKYGADMTTRTGNTVYGNNCTADRGAFDFNQNLNPIFTIWDAGGNDTLDCSLVFDDQRIFLQAGMYSDIKGMKGNIAIAFGATIENAIGGFRNDAINGNEVVNRLEGRLGDDDLDGREGADILIGGKGNDRYTVDTAGYYDAVVSSIAFASPGKVVVDRPFPYIPGDQVIELENEGIDTVSSYISYTLPNAVEHLELIGNANLNGYGNALDNKLSGNAGVNRLEGRAGNDTLDGRAGDDVMVGGKGDDTYYVDDNTGPGLVVYNFVGVDTGVLYNPGDQVFENANEGTDHLFTTVNYTLPNHVEFLTLAAGAGNINGYGNGLANTLFGNEGQNQLGGGAGNDFLDGQGGADTMSGGQGDDTYILDTQAIFHYGIPYSFFLAGDQVIEKAGEGQDRVYAPFSYSLTENVEELALTGAGNLDGYGNAGDNGLLGNSGVNRLEAYAGRDFLNGLEGADIMVGGTGDDRYRVDNISDVVIEKAGEGTDTIETSISFVLPNHVENLALLTRVLSSASAPTTLNGNALANRLIGDAGANILNGRAGVDTLQGGTGNDSYFVDNVGDKIVEASGQGTDNVYTSVSFSLGAGVSAETMRTVASAATTAINLSGNEFGNVLIGNAGANVLNGRGGVDTMAGAAGNDSYFVDNAGDKIVEASGQGTDNVNTSVSFSLATGVSIETLRTSNVAGTTAINLTGNNLANSVIGNAGSNAVNGGSGNDKLTGNAGNDFFVFNTALNAATNVDTVTDFVVVNDTFRLENSFFTGLAAGALTADAFHIGAAAADAEDRIIYNSGTGALSFDSDGTGAGGLIKFAQLTAGLALTNADFVIV